MARLRAILICVLACSFGANAWVDRAKEDTFIGKRRNWWAFQKPVRPAAPQLSDPWVRTPIDAFILKALNDKKLQPSEPLDRQRLIRRVTLDLTGLPPTPAEVDQFVHDRRPDAYERLVDRLLASPHYGERWAQRWLDVIRYADTNGYELDATRTHAWRYRDYVVRSFNTAKPFDRFVREQIAGDELYPGDVDALVATGFHRAGPAHIVGGNQDEEMNRQEQLSEMAAGIGSVFLGVTVQCAKCHNHKFDPILQADYYRLQAIFGATEGADIDISTPQERARYEQDIAAYKARLAPVEKQIAEIEKPYRERLQAAKEAKLDPKLREALLIPKDKRTEEQKRLAKDAKSQTGLSWDEVVNALSPEDKAARAVLRRRLHEIELTEPDPLPTAYAVEDAPIAQKSFILKIGDPKHRMDPVDPGFPSVLVPDNGHVSDDVTGRRSALAQWITSPDQPLTARVMVNRIWQLRMGVGIVATPNDFGVMGQRPTNRDLLDWLATEFVSSGWSIKAIDRAILLSSVYQQSSANDAEKAKIDPDNKLYWRAHRRRLEGEMIRDSVLAVSGKLNQRMGGKPVLAPIEKEIYEVIFTEGEPDNLWPLLPDENEHNRRSLYLLNKRTVRLPMLANFDQPDAMTSCPLRPVSTHALQALTMINSDFMHKQAQAFAQRLQNDCGSDRTCQVRRAYSLTLARDPKPVETTMAQDFLSADGKLSDFCLALLNRNEFVYLP